jgi:hypothetical protein
MRRKNRVLETETEILNAPSVRFARKSFLPRIRFWPV